MKLSLVWIFDHLKTSLKEHDIPALMRRFNTTIAEIGSYEHITFTSDAFTLAQVKNLSESKATLFSPELTQEYNLENRPGIKIGQFFLLFNHKGSWHWATEKNFGSGKDGLLPAISVPEGDQAGLWKKNFETEDYIITIDNIALTHRPDLWSHRGLAREVGALLDVALIPEETLLAKTPIKNGKNELASEQLTLENMLAPTLCSRFAAMHIASIENKASSLSIAHRLARIDSRPISSIVDATNYVMFDIGQPLHAFDAQKVASKKLIVTESQNNQTLTLLDQQEITLEQGAMIISDGKKPLALAGIMGGLASAVHEETSSLYVEAAHFNPAKIRKTSQHYKIRTEASTRFEKNIDPQGNIIGLRRFLKVLSDQSLTYTPPTAILSLGDEGKPHNITVAHAMIERLLGVVIEPAFVVKTLTALSFNVKKNEKPSLEYCIEVPSFRSTKDVLIAQDIIEEIGRYFGFDAITPLLPSLPLKPSNITRFNRTTMIKEYLAYGACAHETYNYAVFDEEFLKLLSWNPEHTIAIKNPVSSTMYRLVTSLVPNLLKNVVTNATHKDTYNFFEINKVWHKKTAQTVDEKTHIAGVFFDTKQEIDFYEKKEILVTLFQMLGLTISWRKAHHIDAWYHPYQTAELWYNNKCIGYAGMANPTVLNTVMPGSAFIFELNGDTFLEAEIPLYTFQQLPKYQDAWRDISMMVPLPITVQQITDLIRNVSPAIVSVELIDFFQKEEWLDERSITMRFFIRNDERTLVSQEIDTVYDAVIQMLQKDIGATIR